MSDFYQLGLWILGAAATLAAGLALGLYAMRSIRNSRHRGAIMVASALFLSFGLFEPKKQEWIEEANDTTKRKKDSQSGDPPSPEV